MLAVAEALRAEITTNTDGSRLGVTPIIWNSWQTNAIRHDLDMTLGVDVETSMSNTVTEGDSTTEVFNIGGDCEKTNLDVTRSILDIMNKSYDLIGISENEKYVGDPYYKPLEAPYYRPGQDSRYGTDYSKLTNHTGWKPSIKFEDGLNEVVMEFIEK